MIKIFTFIFVTSLILTIVSGGGIIFSIYKQIRTDTNKQQVAMGAITDKQISVLQIVSNINDVLNLLEKDLDVSQKKIDSILEVLHSQVNNDKLFEMFVDDLVKSINDIYFSLENDTMLDANLKVKIKKLLKTTIQEELNKLHRVEIICPENESLYDPQIEDINKAIPTNTKELNYRIAEVLKIGYRWKQKVRRKALVNVFTYSK